MMQHEPRGVLTLSQGFRITIKGPIVEALDLSKDSLLVYYLVKIGDEPAVILRKLPSIQMVIPSMSAKPSDSEPDPESLFAPNEPTGT